MPNPWDVGSAKLLASLGFQALATTSSGHAATLGRLDGSITRDEALSHAADIVGATELPVNADFENGFADDPAGVGETVRLAVEGGVGGWAGGGWRPARWRTSRATATTRSTRSRPRPSAWRRLPRRRAAARGWCSPPA